MNPNTQSIEVQPVYTQKALTAKDTQIMLSFENFFSGMQTDKIIPNTTNCFFRITNETFVGVPSYIFNFTNLIPYIIYDMVAVPTPTNILLITTTFSLYT